MQVDQEEGVQKSQAEQQNQADEETENPGTETKVCVQYWYDYFCPVFSHLLILLVGKHGTVFRGQLYWNS